MLGNVHRLGEPQLLYLQEVFLDESLRFLGIHFRLLEGSSYDRTRLLRLYELLRYQIMKSSL